ncbi:DUF6998 domain-containing protein [Arthrobacter sp. NPDC057259]|uniref:DUF6998 domain-containing protein n=1 Tax=Arthrobacter sp. NPDC057259 TaxID=3346073 RepID=UPI00362F323C
MGFDVSSASELELIETLERVKAELKRRDLVRTRSTVGDFGEYLAVAMYGGALSPKGSAGYDLIDSKGRKVQVKTRSADVDLSSRKFAGLGKGGFEVCLFLCLTTSSYRPHLAREVDGGRVAKLLDSYGRVSYGKIRNEGIDVLETALAAYEVVTGVR